MQERGLNLTHTTIMRWVHQYSPIIDERVRKHLKSTNDSWRMDETYLKIKGKNAYLYRTVDSAGNTIDFFVSEHRDKDSAKKLFKKALKTIHNQQPRVITTDKYAATEVAIHEMIYSAIIDVKATIRQGEGAARCMKLAIEDAGIQPQDISYINAHGTSTPLGDKNETTAIKTVFQKYAYELAVSSTKSMTGHLLGAAGAIEAIITASVLKDGFLPPTINYKTKDQGCDLYYVPNEGEKAALSYALSNSFGFGGHNATLKSFLEFGGGQILW